MHCRINCLCILHFLLEFYHFIILSYGELTIFCSKNLQKGMGAELIVIVMLNTCGNFTNNTRDGIEWMISKERNRNCWKLEPLVLTLESMAAN